MLLGLVAAVSLTANSQQQRGSVDWIFVLDTSASMHGAGGTADIFEKVKGAIAEFVRNARDGDTVTLYTFDRDTTLRTHIRVSGEIDKKDLLKTVGGLSSSGDRTYTGKAIHDALERAIEFRERSDAANRTTSIVLFTDGVEDVRGIPDPVSIPSNISLVPRAKPYIFFVSLGVQAHDTQVEKFVQDASLENRGEVIRDPGAAGIAEVGERIRTRLEAPPPPPKPLKITLDPARLAFGKIEPGETSSQTIQASCDADCRLRVALNTSPDSGLSLTEPKDVVSLKAGESQSIEIGLAVAKHLNDGLHNFALVFTAEPPGQGSTPATENVEGTVEVARTPIWWTVLKYLLLLLLLILIALVVISVLKGEPPWIWFPAIVGRANLEGELQVIHPRPARVEDEFISLTQLRTKKVSLGLLIPNGVTDGSDAELEVIKKNGKLGVKLHRIKGNVYVNKVEVAQSEIYNDDVIELGGSRLLFNWVNHDRPLDSEADEI